MISFTSCNIEKKVYYIAIVVVDVIIDLKIKKKNITTTTTKATRHASLNILLFILGISGFFTRL